MERKTEAWRNMVLKPNLSPATATIKYREGNIYVEHWTRRRWGIKKERAERGFKASTSTWEEGKMIQIKGKEWAEKRKGEWFIHLYRVGVTFCMLLWNRTAEEHRHTYARTQDWHTSTLHTNALVKGRWDRNTHKTCTQAHAQLSGR